MKFNKNILVLLFVLMGFSTTGWGQSHHVLLGASQNMTNFKFTDNDNDIDTSYSPQYSSGFNLGYNYKIKEGVYFQGRIGIRNAGASYVFDDFSYNWNIRYGEFRLGAGYQYDFSALYVHFSAEGYLSYVMSAEQRLFNVYRDMIEAGTIERLDYGLFLSPGVGIGLTENISLELDINYMLGFGNLDTDEGQTTQNRLWGVNLGLNIKI